MMAQIVEQSAMIMKRKFVPSDAYFGDADPEEDMVVQTILVEWQGARKQTFQRHFSWATKASELL